MAGEKRHETVAVTVFEAQAFSGDLQDRELRPDMPPKPMPRGMQFLDAGLEGGRRYDGSGLST
jgi:hypothetical protein